MVMGMMGTLPFSAILKLPSWQDIKAGLKTILAAIDKVKNGISICIFPEGTRNKTKDNVAGRSGNADVGQDHIEKAAVIAHIQYCSIGGNILGLKDKSSLAIVNWAFRQVIRLAGTKVIAIGEENLCREPHFSGLLPYLLCRTE